MAECYFILADQRADFVFDLFRYSWRPENTYVFHADLKAPVELHQLVGRLAARFANVHVVPARLCSWGGFSLVEATLAGIKVGLEADANWRHFLVLSETHLPLRPPEILRLSLTPDVSEIDASPAAEMQETARDDLRHRFACAYQEVPGVGCYPRAALGEVSLEGIWHGSQWMVLSRAAAAFAVLPRDVDIWAGYRRSLLPDETALQSVVAAWEGGTVNRRHCTWVALPGRGGDHNQTLNEDGFAQARRDEKFLFIRKRPDILPPAIAAALEFRVAFSGHQLRSTLATLPADAPAAAAKANPDELVLHLRWQLANTNQALRIERRFPPAYSPHCLIDFQIPDSGPGLTLHLQSEDMRTFKVLLLWHTDFGGRHEELAFFGLPARLNKGRVYGQFLQREIVLGAAANDGFVTLASLADLAPLMAVLNMYLAVFGMLTKAMRRGGFAA